jgi:hypothetical protein
MDLIENSLSIVEACLLSHCLAMGIHVTVCFPGCLWSVFCFQNLLSQPSLFMYYIFMVSLIIDEACNNMYLQFFFLSFSSCVCEWRAVCHPYSVMFSLSLHLLLYWQHLTNLNYFLVCVFFIFSVHPCLPAVTWVISGNVYYQLRWTAKMPTRGLSFIIYCAWAAWFGVVGQHNWPPCVLSITPWSPSAWNLLILWILLSSWASVISLKVP